MLEEGYKNYKRLLPLDIKAMCRILLFIMYPKIEE